MLRFVRNQLTGDDKARQNASIVADEDGTTVYMFDGNYLRSMVEQEPSVGELEFPLSVCLSD